MNMSNEDNELSIEEYQPGHKRRLTKEINGVTLCISHRMSSKNVVPEIWSAWVFWGHFENAETAVKRHNEA